MEARLVVHQDTVLPRSQDAIARIQTAVGVVWE